MKKILLVVMFIFSGILFSAEGRKSEIESKVYQFVNSQPVNSEDIEDIYNAIIKSSKEFDVDPQLIATIIKHESGFDQFAKSSAGAIGLMQLMPGTADSMGVVDIYDIFDNIRGGVKYFKQCLVKNKNDIPLALASYNAGIGNVLKYNGIPPFKETQNYVDKILNTYNKKFGKKVRYNEVEFEKAVDGIFSEITFENAEEGEIGCIINSVDGIKKIYHHYFLIKKS
ncbi:lytic transglycosylase domain-containing protein [Fusobacterium nucleatum]